MKPNKLKSWIGILLLSFSVGWVGGLWAGNGNENGNENGGENHKVTGKVGWIHPPARPIKKDKDIKSQLNRFWNCMGDEEKKQNSEGFGKSQFLMSQEQQAKSWIKVRECTLQNHETDIEVWLNQCHHEWFFFKKKNFNSCHYLKSMGYESQDEM